MEIFDSVFMFAYDIVNYVCKEFLSERDSRLPRCNFSKNAVKILTPERKRVVDRLCQPAMREHTRNPEPFFSFIGSEKECHKFLKVTIDLYKEMDYNENLFLELCTHLAIWSADMQKGQQYEFAPYIAIQRIYELTADVLKSGTLGGSTSW